MELQQALNAWKQTLPPPPPEAPEEERKLREAQRQPLAVNGLYGKETRDTVTAYQKAQGLPHGGLTPETLDYLNIQEP